MQDLRKNYVYNFITRLTGIILNEKNRVTQRYNDEKNHFFNSKCDSKTLKKS